MDAMTVGTSIVERLRKKGYQAYFAGGWVRDYVMEHPSSDVDIATDACPEVIVELFEKTIPVGISFASVVVVEGGHHFEVSTFREEEGYSDGRRPDSIRYSTPDKDAHRRDFTINGLFFDPIEKRVIDYVGARNDIAQGVIRTIGDPHVRFREDRLRMIRGVRFSARFGFPIEPNTRQAIMEMAHELFPSVAIERIWQEFQKMHGYPRFDRAITDMYRLGLLQQVFPALANEGEEVIGQRVKGFDRMPGDTPTILYILQLFPSISAREAEQMCRYLKCSNRVVKLALLYLDLREMVQRGTRVEPWEWAHFYAKPNGWLCIEVMAAPMKEPVAEVFMETHRHRLERMARHVERLVQGVPLVTSDRLKHEGIPPGREMGRLMREAERIAINEDLHTAAEVMQRLKETSRWHG